jgi:biopolymer transport protein ExbD
MGKNHSIEKIINLQTAETVQSRFLQSTWFLFVIIFIILAWRFVSIGGLSYEFIPFVDNPRIVNRCNPRFDHCGPDKRCIVVTVDKIGRIFIQRKAVSVRSFYAELRNEVMAQRKDDPVARFICLNADKRVPMSKIYSIVDCYKALEIERIELFTLPQ